MLLCASVVGIAQQIVQYPDTFKATDATTVLTQDALLLQLVQEQGKSLSARQDSVRAERLKNDTTTAFPFHIGFADSLRIDSVARHTAAAYPLAQKPLLYFQPRRLSFKDDNQADSAVTIGFVREKARVYIATHYAELYDGVYDPRQTQDVTIHLQHAAGEKYIVADVEEDSIFRRMTLRDQLSPWRKQATVMLQLTQNYVTKNWYEGGNSSFSMLNIAQGTVIYDDRDRITWENTGEWRFGFTTVAADSLRKVNTTEDLLRLYSKFGYKLFNKVSYTVSAEFETHLFNTWKENTKQKKTAPLTPLKLYLATGLDYRPLDGLSLYFAPLTYKLVYANDTVHTDYNTYGIAQGKQVLNDLGSSFRADWQWHPLREIDLESRFLIYTNYRRVEIDWEITCNFIINRYISTRLSLHPRYDNTVILPDEDKAHIQFKEYLSIGFTHKFR